MAPSWLSLLPPLVVICTALLFRRMSVAFLAGIASACLIAMNGSVSGSFALGTTRLWQTATNTDSLYLYAFLITIGSLIVLFESTGCVSALTAFAVKKLQTKRSAQRASIILSCLLFVDDYLSILTTGHVIRSITDRFGIPREKIAFLIHSLAGSVVVLAPVSSWVGAITAQLAQAGVQPLGESGTQIIADPFFIYLQILPFMFYSFLIVASVWFIVHNHISFGPMLQREKEAQKKQTIVQTESQGNIIDLVLPLGTLLLGMIGGLLYSGSFWLLGGTNGFIDALKSNENPFLIMFIAACCALALGMILALYRRTFSLLYLPKTLLGGTQLMYGAILMVFLSSTLATMLKGDVFTGHYLANVLIGSVSIALLPALFFVVSLICALVTGSSWGTFSLMLSIAIPMLASLFGRAPIEPEMVNMLLPVLGAIFSGAVCGDHLSPISETTVMAASSTGISPIEHARTQTLYALPAALCTLIAFIGTGMLINHGKAIAIGVPLIGACLTCFALLRLFDQK